MNQQNQKEYLASQSLIPVDQIREGVIVLKSGALRSVLNVSGINFELKSESEQNDIINTWKNFLNNLDFPLQVVIHSRKVNISNYINNLKERAKKEPNELLKIQTDDYLEFIQNFVEMYSVIRKSFYVVVPYEPVMVKTSTFLDKFGEVFKSLFNLTRPAFTSTTKLSEEEFSKYQKQLLIRQNNALAGLTRIGLQATPLNTEELIQLLYNLYNPETFEKQKIGLSEQAEA